jgi:hypothetical protein
VDDPGAGRPGFCHECGRVRTHRTPTLFFSRPGASAENYVLATEAGIDDFLPKPLDPITIQMRLRVAHRILWFTREVHQLKQLIPICAYCHKIHTAKDYWQRFETYIKQQTGSDFSHGICQECLEAEMTKSKCAN